MKLQSIYNRLHSISEILPQLVEMNAADRDTEWQVGWMNKVLEKLAPWQIDEEVPAEALQELLNKKLQDRIKRSTACDKGKERALLQIVTGIKEVLEKGPHSWSRNNIWITRFLVESYFESAAFSADMLRLGISTNKNRSVANAIGKEQFRQMDEGTSSPRVVWIPMFGDM